MRPHRCAKFQQRMQIESGRRQHDSLCSVECDVLHTSSAGCRVTQWNFALALSTAGRLVFQTKSKRGCSCGEDTYWAVLAISCANHAQRQVKPAGMETQSGRLHQFFSVTLGSPESSPPKSFCGNSERSQREDVLVARVPVGEASHVHRHTLTVSLYPIKVGVQAN